MWRISGLLVAFGITLAIYVVWVITVGGVNTVQFMVVWLAIFSTVKVTQRIAYLIAISGAFVLAFPISTFIYFPPQGVAQFTGDDFLEKELYDSKTYAMIALYVVVLCGATYLIRNRKAAG